MAPFSLLFRRPFDRSGSTKEKLRTSTGREGRRGSNRIHFIFTRRKPIGEQESHPPPFQGLGNGPFQRRRATKGPFLCHALASSSPLYGRLPPPSLLRLHLFRRGCNGNGTNKNCNGGASARFSRCEMGRLRKPVLVITDASHAAHLLCIGCSFPQCRHHAK